MEQNVCKTCGGDLYRVENHFVCRNCGNRWTVDVADDVHVVDRANAWAALRDADFDHAAELFEIIQEKSPKDHEAFWGLALSGAGIQYVIDIDEHKRVPTCHNIDDRDFLVSKNVKMAIELAPPEIAAAYRQQAEQIERIRLEWQKKARKEEPYDVFLSYKESDSETGQRTKDSDDAYVLYQKLVQRGYRVFFSRVSLTKLISEQYEPYIYNAIKTAKVMIVFGERPEHFKATWIRNEWTRFKRRIDNNEKHPNSLVMVTKNMNPKDLPESLRSRQAVNLDEPEQEDKLFDHIKAVVADAKKGEHIGKISITGGKISKKSSTIAKNTIKKRNLGAESASTSISEKQSLVLVETFIKEKQWEDAQGLLDTLLLNNPDFAEAIWCQLLIRHKVASNTVLMRILDRFKPEDYGLVERALACGSKEFAGLILDLFYQSAKILPNQVRERVYEMILPYRYERREQQLKENFEWSISNRDFRFFKLLLTALEEDDVDQYIEYNARYIKATLDHQEKRECTDNILAVEEGNHVALMYIFESELSTATKPEPIINAFENVLTYSENIDADVEDALIMTTAVLSTPLHCDFAKRLPNYYQGDLKTIRRSLVALAKRMMAKSFFEPAQHIFNLLITLNENDADAFWGLCLAKTESKSEEQIVNSPLLLKKQEEYHKYLALVDNDRRVVCVRLAQKQQNVQKARRRKNIRIIVGASAAAVLVAGAVVTFTVILPNQQLNKANELFASGQYAAAGELYQKLGKFDDSTKRAETVKAILQVEASHHAEAVQTLLAQGIPVEITYKGEGGLLGGEEALALGHTLSTDGSIIPLGTEEVSGGEAELTRTYRNAAEFAELMTPAMTGYNFVGWETVSFNYDITGADPVFHMVLKATWDVRKYAINYELDGGTVVGEIREYTILDGDIVIPKPQRDGYDFLGWISDGATEAAKDVVIPAGSYGNKTFKALWEGLSYTITLDYAMSDEQGPVQEKLTIKSGDELTLPTPERDGYIFDGWWENGASKVQDGVWNRAESITFSAKWHIEEYAIRYHLNGGRNAEFNPTLYTIETESILLSPPTREGYTFMGWSQSADGENPVKDVRILKGSTGDLDLHAVWQVNTSTVTLDTAGGSCATAEISVTYGSQMTLPAPTREGYTFLGWTLNGATVGNGICKITADCTLVASWDAVSYNIDYDLSGGNNHPSNPPSYKFDQSVTLQAPERVGYDFLGWTMDGQTQPVKDMVIPAGTCPAAGKNALIFTAHWELRKFTVTFDAAGGNCDTAELKNLSYGGSLSLPTPTWEGHKFLGWYLGSELVTGGTCLLADACQLTARWEAVQYTITYEGMEDGVNPSENLRVYTCEQSFTLLDPIRTGYDFTGWTYEGQTTPTKDVTISLGEMGDKIFTANWSIKTCQVTLSTSGGTEDGRTLSMTYGSDYVLPTPTLTGHSFEGWYVNGAAISGNGTWLRTENSLTVTAKWSVNTYTVTLENVKEYTNERTITFDDNYPGAQTYTVTYSGGETLRYTVPAERSGFVFVGWYTADGTWFDFTQTLSEDVTLYAQWAETVPYCDGSIALNGAVIDTEMVMQTEKLYAFVSPVTQEIEIHTSHLSGDPFLFLYDADGVEDSISLDGLHDDEYGNSDASLTWTVEAGKVYYIGFNCYEAGIGSLYLSTVEPMDGGALAGDGKDGFWYEEGHSVTVEIRHGDPLELPTPSRSGYTFTGWYAGGVKLESGADFVLGADTVLIAKWR